MSRKPSPYLVLLLLLAVALSLAGRLEPRARSWNQRRAGTGDLLTVLFGDARRMFANHFFVQADIYFHGGYYPSIFDQQARPKDASHMTESHADQDADEAEHAHEKAMSFLGKPKDWIDRFGRHFFVTEHTHLGGGTEREILPWLRVSASLNPQRIETYTVAAYWLRSHLGKVKEAEQFLREGLRANPDSYEILFELGNLYYESRHDAAHGRNVLELAVRCWQQEEQGKQEPDFKALHDITTALGHLEENEGNCAKAIQWFEMAKAHSPNPEALQAQIDALRAKLKAPPPK